MIKELVLIDQIVVVATVIEMIAEIATVMIANQEISFAVVELLLLNLNI
jgi:hypothetical protein